MSKKVADSLLTDAEAGIRAVLNDPRAKVSDRLKAIEIASKLLMIKHKIEGGSADGSFFGSSGN
jgi:hypothetical protein